MPPMEFGSSTSQQQLLTVEEVAHVLGVSKRTVWRLIAGRELDTVRIGRCVRIKALSVYRLVERGGVA